MRLYIAFILMALLAAAMTACGGSPDAREPQRPPPAVPTAEPATATAPAWDPSAVVRIGTSADFPPSNFINAKGEIDGFERELGDELCRRTGLQCEWVQNDWATIIPNLLAGNYDAIIAGMSATEERDDVVDFTQAYFPNTPSAYIALAGAGDEVINGNVAVQVNTIQHDYLAEVGATRIVSLPAEDIVEAVKRGDADAAFADKTFLEAFVEESDGKLEFVGPEITFEFSSPSIAVRPVDTELRQRLSAAIGEMKADGSLNDLIRKWFGEDAAVF